MCCSYSARWVPRCCSTARRNSCAPRGTLQPPTAKPMRRALGCARDAQCPVHTQTVTEPHRPFMAVFPVPLVIARRIAPASALLPAKCTALPMHNKRTRTRQRGAQGGHARVRWQRPAAPEPVLDRQISRRSPGRSRRTERPRRKDQRWGAGAPRPPMRVPKYARVELAGIAPMCRSRRVSADCDLSLGTIDRPVRGRTWAAARDRQWAGFDGRPHYDCAVTNA